MVGRGVVAGLAGTVVMTAFQRFVEMPLTGRAESYAPANFAQKLLPVAPTTEGERRALNYAAHFVIGAAWGIAHGVAVRRGLRGQRAVATVFGLVYTGDAIVNTLLGLYQPRRWSAQDWAVDLGDKLLLAEVTGAVYERLGR